MRDSNWSPDFSMSAEKALEFYDLEKGTEPRIDGVIGITPQVIADLLKVVGPIEIDGLKFAAENFWETLQYEVEYGYQTKGTAFSERKSVIGKLGIELQNRLFKLPLSGLGRVVETLKDNLEIKQIVFYFKDAELQKVVEDYDWAGRVKGAKLDYFMVVDANLAALKTDPFVQRSIQYSLSADGAAPYAELKIKYDHQGKFDLLVTRYRSWTRVYLPSDIEIVDVKVGGKKVEYVVENDLGKKTVGLFLTVEPQTSEVILIKYKFGKSWQSELAKNGYSLLIQKQIGLPSAALIFDLTLPYEVGSFPPIGTKVAGNRIIYNGEMIRDVEAGIVK
jgi:hypothetical protein